MARLPYQAESSHPYPPPTHLSVICFTPQLFFLRGLDLIGQFDAHVVLFVGGFE